MNVSVKNIHNCENLNKKEINLIATKLNINDNNKNINNNNNNNNNNNDDKKKLCSKIKKKYNIINPCGLTLFKDTDLTIKKHQLSVSNFLYNNRGITVIHSVGTGKTLTAISTSQCLLLNNIVKKIIVITPTSLQQNFKQQMDFYGIDEKFKNKYHFYTITGITNAINNKTVISPNNSLIIIDEAHNLRTLEGNRFNVIFKYSKKATKIMLLTATPFVNYISDIINLVSLTTGNNPITKEQFVGMVYDDDQSMLMKYLHSIFNIHIKKQNDNNFPKKKIFDIFLEMDKEYLKIYNDIENGEVKKIPDFKNKNIHVFYNGLRRASNIIDNKSPKVDWVIDKINENKTKKFVIFSHFITMGLKPIMNYLDKHNIKYDSVMGDMSIEKRQIAVNKYNNNTIKILFISKAGSEGLDLKNTNYVIILEPSWNEGEIEQIIGRAVRYKSHESLSENKRVVNIYKLFCIKPIEYKNLNEIINGNYLNYKDKMLSVDLYLRNFSITKNYEILNFFEFLQKIF